MATVQNLERLRRMLESIEGDDSLEAAVASERLNAMMLRTQQVQDSLRLVELQAELTLSSACAEKSLPSRGEKTYSHGR